MLKHKAKRLAKSNFDKYKVCPVEYSKLIGQIKDVYLEPKNLSKESPFKDIEILCSECKTIPINAVECT